MESTFKGYIAPAAAQKHAVPGIDTTSPSTGGQIDVELNMMETTVDGIIDCKRALLRRLYQVTGLPADSLEPVPTGLAPAGPPKVPMADRVQYLREKLEQTIRDFDQLISRIEI